MFKRKLETPISVALHAHNTNMHQQQRKAVFHQVLEQLTWGLMLAPCILHYGQGFWVQNLPAQIPGRKVHKLLLPGTWLSQGTAWALPRYSHSLFQGQSGCNTPWSSSLPSTFLQVFHYLFSSCSAVTSVRRHIPGTFQIPECFYNSQITRMF